MRETKRETEKLRKAITTKSKIGSTARYRREPQQILAHSEMKSQTLITYRKEIDENKCVSQLAARKKSLSG